MEEVCFLSERERKKNKYITNHLGVCMHILMIKTI